MQASAIYYYEQQTPQNTRYSFLEYGVSGGRMGGDCKAAYRRWCPAKEAKGYQVRAARAFLEKIGVTL